MRRSSRLLPNRVSTSRLQVLTPNEKKQIIKKERDRRRLIRFIQVRQQSSQNASKIREKVRAEKRKEIELIRKEITDAMIRRNILRPLLSPVELNFTEKLISPPSHKSRKLSEEENRLIAKRNKEALIKLKKQREEHRAKIEKAANLRKKAIMAANLRSKRNPEQV